MVLLSTYVGAEPVESIEGYDKAEKISIDWPKIVKEYNAHINSWVLYKSVETKKGFELRKLMNLAEFRTELADVLCTYGAVSQPTRGCPSNSSIDAAGPQEKRKKGCQILPAVDVRRDNLGHHQV